MDQKKDIQLLFNEWNLALQSADSEKVIALYAHDAILLPTLSPLVRRNHNDLKDYFDFFLKFEPRAEISDENIRIFDDVAINSGIYIFYIKREGEIQQLPVRYTFVYKKTGDRWLIVEHHSSAMPKPQ